MKDYQFAYGKGSVTVPLDERSVLDIYGEVREDGYMEIDLCFPLK